MKFFGIVNFQVNGNIYENEFYFNDCRENQSKQSEDNDKHQSAESNGPVEDVESVEVNESSKSNSSFSMRNDYSDSPLIPYLTYPEKSQYFIGWLHKHMDCQIILREIIKPLRAAYERGYFKSDIPYQIFSSEFGPRVSQAWYSRLMKEKGRYSDDELMLVLEGLKI